MKESGEEGEGRRGREGLLEGGRESGSKWGGVMSLGQDEKRDFDAVNLERTTPRSCGIQRVSSARSSGKRDHARGEPP